MKRRWVKGLSIVLVVMVTVLAGCGKKDDFDYDGNYRILWEKYQALEKSQNGTGITCQPTGTGYFQMDVNNSLMVFPSQFGYPNSTSGVPGYTITFNEGLCSLNAQSGWEITAVQSVLYTYNKEQMIQGQFSPGKLNKEGGSTEADKDALQAYIKSWFETASTDYTFSDIYLGDSTKAGVSGRCTVQIDGQSYVINCGMVSDGKTTLTYMFTYAGGINQTKEDAIKNLVGQCFIGNRQIRIM